MKTMKTNLKVKEQADLTVNNQLSQYFGACSQWSGYLFLWCHWLCELSEFKWNIYIILKLCSNGQLLQRCDVCSLSPVILMYNQCFNHTVF